MICYHAMLYYSMVSNGPSPWLSGPCPASSSLPLPSLPLLFPSFAPSVHLSLPSSSPPSPFLPFPYFLPSFVSLSLPASSSDLTLHTGTGGR